MPRTKAILTLNTVEFPRRGRGAKGTVTVSVLGTVTKAEGQRAIIDTDALQAASVDELAKVAERHDIHPAQAFADGINMHLVRRAFTAGRQTGVKTGELVDEITRRKLAENDADAKRAAREVKKLAKLLHLDPRKVLDGIKGGEANNP